MGFDFLKCLKIQLEKYLNKYNLYCVYLNFKFYVNE